MMPVTHYMRLRDARLLAGLKDHQSNHELWYDKVVHRHPYLYHTDGLSPPGPSTGPPDGYLAALAIFRSWTGHHDRVLVRKYGEWADYASMGPYEAKGAQALRKAGYVSPQMASLYSDRELFDVPNIGWKAIARFRAWWEANQ